MEEISLRSEAIFQIHGFPVTNSLLAAWLAVVILISLTILVRLRLNKIPGRLQAIFELMIESLLGLMEEIYQDKKIARQVFPWVATFFLFILFSNWVGILPGFGSVGKYENSLFIPFLRPANADLNNPLALAILSVFLAQVFGIIAAGFFRYLKRFFNLKNPITFFVGILELFSEMVKVVSFSFRLFGNIFAGEVLLLVISSLVPLFAPLPFYMLEIFVGFIQALVFTMLTIVFIRLALLIVEEEH